jgi:hypothetical protein
VDSFEIANFEVRLGGHFYMIPFAMLQTYFFGAERNSTVTFPDLRDEHSAPEPDLPQLQSFTSIFALI